MGKNNSGRVSFQTKFAQQVSCLSIVVVYIVLCSEMYNCTRKIANLEPSADQDNSRSISGALQACFGFHDFFHHCWWENLSFHFLDHISNPNFVRERGMTLQGLLTDTLMSINREAPDRWKKSGQDLRLVGRRRDLESPRRYFRLQIIDMKTLISVTVHL